MTARTARARRKHPMAPPLMCSAVLGGLIAFVDVRVLEELWPTLLALFISCFLVTWLWPSRWITVSFTHSIMMWLAFAWVRVPWWTHPDEVGAHDFSVGVVVVPALLGAVLAAKVQEKRGKV